MIAQSIPALVVFYAFLSVLCFIVYALDKRASRTGRRRTPERTLLLLGLIGGWPGALLAQRVLRHKSSKRAFQLKFWFTVLLHCALVAVIIVTTRM